MPYDIGYRLYAPHLFKALHNTTEAQSAARVQTTQK